MAGDYLMQGLIDRLLEKLDETLGQVVRKAHDIDTHTESEALPSVHDSSASQAADERRPDERLAATRE